jgi:DNA polymerase III delta prime subunit
MGIDDVRALIKEAYLMPLVGTKRVFLLAYSSFTEEAQNALLKLLEEPPTTARFYVITERADVLLPTLRSRLTVEEIKEQQPLRDIFEAFLALSPGLRIKEIGVRAEKKDDEWLLTLMKGFEEWAHEKKDRAFMRTFLDLQSLYHTQGASKKMILEHLALLLP